MSEALNRAERYQKLANECTQLAMTATSITIRHHYEYIAEQYLLLAKGELSLAAAQGNLAKE